MPVYWWLHEYWLLQDTQRRCKSCLRNNRNLHSTKIRYTLDCWHTRSRSSNSPSSQCSSDRACRSSNRHSSTSPMGHMFSPSPSKIRIATCHGICCSCHTLTSRSTRISMLSSSGPCLVPAELLTLAAIEATPDNLNTCTRIMKQTGVNIQFSG